MACTGITTTTPIFIIEKILFGSGFCQRGGSHKNLRDPAYNIIVFRIHGRAKNCFCPSLVEVPR